MRNKCYECPFMSDVPGSAHIQCNHPVSKANKAVIIEGIAAGKHR